MGGRYSSIYGFMTLFLLPFINCKPKTLFIWAGILFILTTPLTFGHTEKSKKEQKELATYIEQSDDVYANGSYLDIYDFRANTLPPGMDDPSYIFIILIFAPIFYAPLFLLGMGFAKKQAFVNMEDEKKWYKLGALLVPIGLACKSFSFIENNFSNLLLMGGSQLLAIGYVCLTALLIKSRPVHLLSPVFESGGNQLSNANHYLYNNLLRIWTRLI